MKGQYQQSTETNRREEENLHGRIPNSKPCIICIRTHGHMSVVYDCKVAKRQDYITYPGVLVASMLGYTSEGLKFDGMFWILQELGVCRDKVGYIGRRNPGNERTSSTIITVTNLVIHVP